MSRLSNTLNKTPLVISFVVAVLGGAIGAGHIEKRGDPSATLAQVELGLRAAFKQTTFFVLVVRSDTSDLAFIEGWAAPLANMRTLQFKNIGTAPAVTLRCHVGSTNDGSDTVPLEGPMLAPGEKK